MKLQKLLFLFISIQAILIPQTLDISKLDLKYYQKFKGQNMILDRKSVV